MISATGTRASPALHGKTLTCGFAGALGGTRTPSLLIRSLGRTVQICPGVAVLWGDVPGLSSFVGGWPRSWQQSWQQPGICDRCYALRARHVRCSRGSKPAPASCSQVAAGSGRCLLMAVRGDLGGTPVLHDHDLSLLAVARPMITSAPLRFPACMCQELAAVTAGG